MYSLQIFPAETTVCDNARFRRGQGPDEQYTECEALIPAVKEKVNKNGELTLNCDLQDTSVLPLGTCFWRLPDEPNGDPGPTCFVSAYSYLQVQYT